MKVAEKKSKAVPGSGKYTGFTSLTFDSFELKVSKDFKPEGEITKLQIRVNFKHEDLPDFKLNHFFFISDAPHKNGGPHHVESFGSPMYINQVGDTYSEDVDPQASFQKLSKFHKSFDSFMASREKTKKRFFNFVNDRTNEVVEKTTRFLLDGEEPFAHFLQVVSRANKFSPGTDILLPWEDIKNKELEGVEAFLQELVGGKAQVLIHIKDNFMAIYAPRFNRHFFYEDDDMSNEGIGKLMKAAVKPDQWGANVSSFEWGPYKPGGIVPSAQVTGDVTTMSSEEQTYAENKAQTDIFEKASTDAEGNPISGDDLPF